MKYLIGPNKPEGFSVALSVAGCLCKYKGAYLMLKRHEESPQGGTWCIPAGKLEQGESPIEGCVRELYEETGVKVQSALLKKITLFYVRLPHVDFEFHLYTREFCDQPEVILSNEHTEYSWKTIEEALQLPLIAGGKELLNYVRKT